MPRTVALCLALVLTACLPAPEERDDADQEPSTADAPAGPGARELAPLDLSRGWRFRVGDDPRFSRPELDDGDWEAIEVGRSWERAGHAGLDGYAWYRLEFELPKSWRASPHLAEASFFLELGTIDDVDATWLNGRQLGTTGRFPPDYEPAWKERRNYELRGAELRSESENVLAVRVYDGAAEGGFLRGPYRLRLATWRDRVRLRLGTGRGDGIYLTSPMELTVHLESRSDRALPGRLRWEVRSDAQELVLERDGPLELEAGEREERLDFTPPAPGFYRVRCEFEHAGRAVEHELLLGFRPEEIVAPSTAAPDFDAFWNESRAALAAVDPEFRIIEESESSSESRRLYEVEMRSFGGVRVRGWYEVPREATRERPLPALLRVPGYGSAMRPLARPSGRFDDLVVFSFNPRGHGNSTDEVPHDPENYWIRGLDRKESYFYRGAYLDCLRAVDFLVSRPEVDGDRIAVTGGSQGGGLSLATAALDERIALCAPDIPFLCDWVDYFELTRWPEINGWIAAREERTWKSTLATLAYFDTLNLAPRIHCPVFIGLGLQDPVCPARTIFAVYNRIPGEKRYHVDAYAEHHVPLEHSEAVEAWLREKFGLEPR